MIAPNAMELKVPRVTVKGVSKHFEKARALGYPVDEATAGEVSGRT